jgi:ketosteroid isomerase-like protein
MSVQANREVSRRFHDEVIVGNDWDVARELLHPEVRHLRGAIGMTIVELDPEGAAGLRAHAGAERFIHATELLRSLFPRWDSRLLVMIAEDNRVFTHCVVSGTLGVPLRGAAAGTDFELHQAVVQTIENGRITEIFALSDQLDLWRALGVPAVG